MTKTCAAVAVTKIELDRIGPSAAVPSFGMCPEPSPIKPSHLPERARHPARGLSCQKRRVASLPSVRRMPAADFLPKKVWPAWADEAGHQTECSGAEEA